ncbi:MGT family glycosyltransferase [Lentzea guizhouensis]|uniref:MGT family glycosyltransferase n=1 Tax=Lentzea guizhouensis TaxID=1586287 RepID=A0A1B2I0X3_9PSEU|nr:glycosyltransferase [Lentzea guizhouensis]ANZ43624.1 MGT family glycosyltransferase [Lentzea guizhouensis]
MSQRPILFVSLPESGLLNPMLVLAEELSRRGVEDLWFATDDKGRDEVEAAAVGSPIRFVSLGDVVPEMSSVTWPDDVYAEVTQRSRFKARKAVIAQTFRPSLRIPKYRELEAAVENIKPALMVVESMCMFGYELAITKGIPYVVSNPFVPSNLVTSVIPIGPSYTPKDFPRPHTGLPAAMTWRQRWTNRLFGWRTLATAFTKQHKERNAENDRVVAELGISPKTRGQFARVENSELVLCYSIPEMDYPFDVPEKIRTVGALVPPLPQAERGELDEWLDAQKSVVYMGFGTITRLTREQVAAFVEVARRLDCSVLWKLPRDQQVFLPAELPANLRIETWVPSQLDVLAHPNVHVFFTHAGGNAYTESIYFGKPMVSRPLWVDCYDQAVRAESFGVGLTLDRPHTVDPDDVVDKLTRVLTEPGFRENAERLAALQHAAGGRKTAADLVLSLPALTAK